MNIENKLNILGIALIIAVIISAIIIILLIGPYCENCDSFSLTNFCTKCGHDNSNLCNNCNSLILNSYEYCPGCGKYIGGFDE